MMSNKDWVEFPDSKLLTLTTLEIIKERVLSWNSYSLTIISLWSNLEKVTPDTSSQSRFIAKFLRS